MILRGPPPSRAFPVALRGPFLRLQRRSRPRLARGSLFSPGSASVLCGRGHLKLQYLIALDFITILNNGQLPSPFLQHIFGFAGQLWINRIVPGIPDSKRRPRCPEAAPQRVNVLYGLKLFGVWIFMSFGKVHPVQSPHPPLLCGQLPQVPVADMAQNERPAFLSLTSFLTISPTIPRRTRRINIVDMLLETYSSIFHHFGTENRPLCHFAASTERSVSLVAS